MKKVLLFESFIAENEKETAKEIFDELMDVNGEEIADIDSQEAMTILSRRGIRGGKANKIAKELLKLTSAIGESVVTEAAKPKEVKAVEKLIKAKGEEHFDVEGTWLFNHSTYNDDQEETVQFSWDAENGYDVTDEDGRELYIGTDAKAAVKAFKSVIESVVNEAKSFSESELKSTAQSVADAVAKVYNTKANLIEFEMNPAKGRVAGFYVHKATNKKGAPSRYWITDSGEVVSAFRNDTFGDGVVGKVGSSVADFIKTFKANESVVNESDAALKKEIKEAKKELKQLQKDYSDIADECKDLRSEIVDIKNDIKTHEQDGEDDMADMAGEQLEEKEEELELRLNDLDQCKMELDEVKDWLKNPS